MPETAAYCGAGAAGAAPLGCAAGGGAACAAFFLSCRPFRPPATAPMAAPFPASPATAPIAAPAAAPRAPPLTTSPCGGGAVVPPACAALNGKRHSNAAASENRERFAMFIVDPRVLVFQAPRQGGARHYRAHPFCGEGRASLAAVPALKFSKASANRRLRAGRCHVRRRSGGRRFAGF